MTGLFLHGLVIGAVLHFTYGYFGAAVHAAGAPEAAAAPEAFAWLHALYAEWDVGVSVVLVADLALGSLLLAFIIFRRPAGLPRWLALANPLVVFVAVRTASALSPAPLGGYSQACFPHIAFFIFFALSTLAVARRARSSRVVI